MSDQNSPNQGKRPAWAQHMDDAAWNEFYAPRRGKDQRNEDAGASGKAPKNPSSNIQEEIISARAKSMADKGYLDPENEKTATSGPQLNVPSQEEIEAAIVKNRQENPADEHEKPTAPASGLEKEKNVDNFGPKGNEAGSTPSSPPPPRKPVKTAADPERPVRGYGLLVFIPLLTLTILLAIHTVGFIYTQSNQIVMENPDQIEVAKSINLSNFFIPSFDGQTLKEATPGQYWFLGAIFKLSPFSDIVNLHMAGAVAALIMLWGTYLLCKIAIPRNKTIAFSTGLILLSNIVFLGGAWFFRTEMLGIALVTLAQAFMLKGLKKPSGAYLWFIPAMLLGALSILSSGIAMSLLLFIPLILYLLVSGNPGRIRSTDFLAGLICLIGLPGAWLGGALFFAGWEKVSSYMFPLVFVAGGDPILFTAGELITYACLLLLPWLILPLLLVDRIFLKIPSFKGGLKTEKGQGILFASTALIGAAAILAIDRFAHPVLGLAILPPMGILAARAVVYMSRSRAKIFILFTALIFTALTALLALRAGGFGTSILPWNIGLWALIPMIGATAFCTLFLARATQVSDGKAMVLVYAICWLLLGQVFLFAAMPSSAKYLQLNEIQAAIKEKTSQSAWTVAYFNTPAWAAGYDLKDSKQVKNLEEIEELASTTQLLLVMPEAEWENLDKKQAPLKKTRSQVLLLTKYILAQSIDAGPPFALSPNPEEPLNNAQAPEETLPAEQNATMDAPALPEDAVNSGQEETNDRSVVEKSDGFARDDKETPSGQNATDGAAGPALQDSRAGDTTQKQDTGITEPLNGAEENTTPQKPEPAEKEKTEDSANQEEIVSTTYTPKAMRQIDLVYGTIPGMPEMSIIVRYREIKRID